LAYDAQQEQDRPKDEEEDPISVEDRRTALEEKFMITFGDAGQKATSKFNYKILTRTVKDHPTKSQILEALKKEGIKPYENFIHRECGTVSHFVVEKIVVPRKVYKRPPMQDCHYGALGKINIVIDPAMHTRRECQTSFRVSIAYVHRVANVTIRA